MNKHDKLLAYELLLTQIQDSMSKRVSGDFHIERYNVIRFCKAIKLIMLGLYYTDDFCPYSCPTITALQVALKAMDYPEVDHVVKETDNMRNFIDKLRQTRKDRMLKAGAKDQVSRNRAYTQGMTEELREGRKVVASNLIVKVIVNPALDTRERAKKAFDRLMQIEGTMLHPFVTNIVR
jgi:hypothetical protein